jgi:hypothetical protein
MSIVTFGQEETSSVSKVGARKENEKVSLNGKIRALAGYAPSAGVEQTHRTVVAFPQ